MQMKRRESSGARCQEARLRPKLKRKERSCKMRERALWLESRRLGEEKGRNETVNEEARNRPGKKDLYWFSTLNLLPEMTCKKRK